MKKNSLKRTHEPETDVAGPQLINVETFAASIQWHPESLRRACRQGRVQAVKLGRGWRISQAVAEEIKKNGIPCPS